jgi:hypothetical protein
MPLSFFLFGELYEVVQNRLDERRATTSNQVSEVWKAQPSKCESISIELIGVGPQLSGRTVENITSDEFEGIANGNPDGGVPSERSWWPRTRCESIRNA